MEISKKYEIFFLSRYETSTNTLDIPLRLSDRISSFSKGFIFFFHTQKGRIEYASF